jgi:hypothetical protein
MTETAKLPPLGEWVAHDDGLTRWMPVAEWLRVLLAPEGGRQLLLRVGGQENELTMNAEQAKHLASLLTG